MKKKDDMQVNVAALRRNMKNIAHNYSEAQKKVREATSNDPWGPSAAIMSEVADFTYNVVAFSEIMQMIWKRLNDHGKNWRHVYKALILLEYLIKTGTEKVAQQCKENIFAIQTLREFVYYEDGKDQGTHVREKAKQLVHLLKDDERLKNERIKALKAKERFAQHASGFGSDGYVEGPTHRDAPPGWQEEPKPLSDLEMVRPQTAGEEELQLQLAMAMSREEADQEEAKRRSDDVRLQLALSQSEQDFKVQPAKQEPQSHLLDLLDISMGATSISTPPPLGAAGGAIDPWGAPVRAASQLSDTWSGSSSPPIDPWQPAAQRPVAGGSAGAVSGGVISGSDAWMSQRTQTPSLVSGAGTTEAWLHSSNLLANGSVTNGNAAVHREPWITRSNAAAVATSTSASHSASATLDPWLAEGRPREATSMVPAETSPPLADPWSPKLTDAANADPWHSVVHKTSPDMDEFDIITNRTKSADLLSNIIITGSNSNNNNNNTSLLDELDPLSPAMISATGTTKKPLKTPQAFLGENSALVNLDNLIKPVVPQSSVGNAAYNPFSDSVIPPKTNLFQQQQPAVPSINQLKQQQPFTMSVNQDPWAPVNNSAVTAQVKENTPIDYDSNGEIRIEYLTAPTYQRSNNSCSNLRSYNRHYNNNDANYNVVAVNYSSVKRSISANDDFTNYNNLYLQQNYNNDSKENIMYGSNKSNFIPSAYSANSIHSSTNDNYAEIPQNNVSNKNRHLGTTDVNSYGNTLAAALAGTPGVTVSAWNAGGCGNLFSYGFYDSMNAGGSASAACQMDNENNNNNMPWVKPQATAAASNPFLS